MKPNPPSPYYFVLYEAGKEYRIYRTGTAHLVAGGFGKTRHATEAEAKRHIARLIRESQAIAA